MKKVITIVLLVYLCISIYSDDGRGLIDHDVLNETSFENLFVNNPSNPFVPNIDNSMTLPDFTLQITTPDNDVNYSLLELEPNKDIDYTIVILDPNDPNDITQIIEFD